MLNSEQLKKLDSDLRAVKCETCGGIGADTPAIDFDIPTNGPRNVCSTCNGTGHPYTNGIDSYLKAHGGEWVYRQYLGEYIAGGAPIYEPTLDILTALSIYETCFGWRWYRSQPPQSQLAAVLLKPNGAMAGWPIDAPDPASLLDALQAAVAV